MIVIAFDVEYEGILADPSEWKKVRKKAYKDAGTFWHKSFAAGHFSNAGAKKYGYRKRTKDYIKKKWREKKHTNPMVWSGTTKRHALTKWRVQGKRGGGAEVIINARGLNRRPSRGSINLRQEMETVITPEVEQMGMAAQNSANKGLAKLARTKRKRKRIRS